MWCSAQLDALKQSQLFHLSLGSKELFHSNFLAWVFCEFGDHAFAAISKRFDLQLGSTSNPQLAVSRERHNLDLTVEFDDGSLLVIENKVKSLPDRDQLLRYGQKVMEKRLTGRTDFVLLSAMSPSFELANLGDDNLTWSYWSYRDLEAIMHEIVATCADLEPYSIALLKDYAEFASALDDLCTRIGLKADDNFLDLLSIDSTKELKSARIHDLVYKLAFQHLTAELDEKIRGHKELPMPSKQHKQKSEAGSIWTGTGFTNGQGFSDIKIQLRDGNNPLVLGIQLQHRSLRLYLESAKGTGLKQAAARLRRAKSWFDFSPGLEFLGSTEYPKARAKEFNHFGKIFLYRSRNLGNVGHAAMSCTEVAGILFSFVEYGFKNRKRIAEIAMQG